MSLFCKSCKAPHDLDMGPDDGTCMICGDKLVEDEGEADAVENGAARATVEAVNDGMVKMYAARKRAPHGEN